MRSLAAALMVAALGGWTLWAATDGARAFTAEGARRLAVQQNPRPVPDARLQTRTGDTLRLHDLQGRLVIVDFIYTRCMTFCTVMGNTLQTLQNRLPAELLGDEVVLLSISFDPEHDTPRNLSVYGDRYAAQSGSWVIARVKDDSQLDALLETFGITVIPDGQGGYQHNAAVHVVDRQGRLARILDFDDPDAAMKAVQELL